MKQIITLGVLFFSLTTLAEGDGSSVKPAHPYQYFVSGGYTALGVEQIPEDPTKLADTMKSELSTIADLMDVIKDSGLFNSDIIRSTSGAYLFRIQNKSNCNDITYSFSLPMNPDYAYISLGVSVKDDSTGKVEHHYVDPSDFATQVLMGEHESLAEQAQIAKMTQTIFFYDFTQLKAHKMTKDEAIKKLLVDAPDQCIDPKTEDAT